MKAQPISFTALGIDQDEFSLHLKKLKNDILYQDNYLIMDQTGYCRLLYYIISYAMPFEIGCSCNNKEISEVEYLYGSINNDQSRLLCQNCLAVFIIDKIILKQSIPKNYIYEYANNINTYSSNRCLRSQKECVEFNIRNKCRWCFMRWIKAHNHPENVPLHEFLEKIQEK